MYLLQLLSVLCSIGSVRFYDYLGTSMSRFVTARFLRFTAGTGRASRFLKEQIKPLSAVLRLCFCIEFANQFILLAEIIQKNFLFPQRLCNHIPPPPSTSSIMFIADLNLTKTPGLWSGKFVSQSLLVYWICSANCKM